ncbi:conserved protein of unknown function [Petrocella atlantisensis]|uniref:Uncharacterized protein n=1 Tax=Petrocella atlantisensis TaxID=2173034 RepID=A0A3P7PDU8_9FIRM|nr:hypothetical protein [Petrocella atlantisensis]VDN47088.1 conserved protein of unknown function [Petrocella atlantisensis]
MSEKKLKRYSIIIAALVTLSAISNVIYASYQVIETPLFTEINDEIYYDGMLDETLTISYIMNNSDTRRLQSISFYGLDAKQSVSQSGGFGGFMYTSDTNNNPYNDEIGRYYTLKQGYINLYLTDEDISRMEEKGSLTFGRGTAIFDDGTIMPVSLGRITIRTEDNWEEHRLRKGGGGSKDHFTADFETETPIRITSLDLSSFEPHRDDLDMSLIVDFDRTYTYDALMNLTEPIEVKRGFEVAYTAKDKDASSEWRFNMISLDMVYEKDGQSYDTWIYYPFYGTGMNEAAVESFVALWRTEHE